MKVGIKRVSKGDMVDMTLGSQSSVGQPAPTDGFLFMQKHAPSIYISGRRILRSSGSRKLVRLSWIRGGKRRRPKVMTVSSIKIWLQYSMFTGHSR